MNAKTNQKPTRCKPGDRARVIAAFLPQNVGRIVFVIRPYDGKEIIGAGLWECDKKAWVVASLGGGIACIHGDDVKVNTTFTAVLNDSHLQPLHDDDGGIEDAATRNTKLKRTRKAPRTAVQS